MAVDKTVSRPGHLGVYGSFLALCCVIAFAGSIANSYGLSGWYPALAKPSFNPPNWVFAPVWTILYIFIAVAGARLWMSEGPGREVALGAYFVQLALNAAWSWVFFFGQAPGAAAIVIVALWVGIAATIALAWTKDRMASVLLMPYLAWVSFAAVLNIAIWRLNG